MPFILLVFQSTFEWTMSDLKSRPFADSGPDHDGRTHGLLAREEAGTQSAGERQYLPMYPQSFGVALILTAVELSVVVSLSRSLLTFREVYSSYPRSSMFSEDLFRTGV